MTTRREPQSGSSPEANDSIKREQARAELSRAIDIWLMRTVPGRSAASGATPPRQRESNDGVDPRKAA